ncbi:MAG TPA: T9SS type A sorting domain-containing protein, partial [Catalimonadaceae bacterium]|nr:T9SS type A sorting domain-containing protein [Catalimonadaceae bacterium]
TCPDLSDTMVVLRIENNLSIHTDTAVCFIGGDSLVLSVPLQFTSFTWSNGATNRTIVLYAADTLIVTATTAQNCTFTDTIRVQEAICDAVRPTMSNQPFQVQLQPNPAVDQAWMQVKTAEPGFARLSVINALGQEIGHNEQLWIGSQMEHRLDTSNLPSGIYTIRLSDGKRHWTGKLVIRK